MRRRTPKPAANRLLLAACVVAWLEPGASRADAPAGISGVVLDAVTHRPIPGVAVALSRRDASASSLTVYSNARGFFVDLGLEPGQYAVSAYVAGRTATCSIEDLGSGQMRRVQIIVSMGERVTVCDARPRGGAFDPDETADVYRIR